LAIALTCVPAMVQKIDGGKRKKEEEIPSGNQRETILTVWTII